MNIEQQRVHRDDAGSGAAASADDMQLNPNQRAIDIQLEMKRSSQNPHAWYTDAKSRGYSAPSELRPGHCKLLHSQVKSVAFAHSMDMRSPSCHVVEYGHHAQWAGRPSALRDQCTQAVLVHGVAALKHLPKTQDATIVSSSASSSHPTKAFSFAHWHACTKVVDALRTASKQPGAREEDTLLGFGNSDIPGHRNAASDREAALTVKGRARSWRDRGWLNVLNQHA
jgi:hypothetical protein